MMRFLYLLLLLVIMVFGVSFAVENNDPVEFRYFIGSVEVALAWLLVLTLALGALVGMLASLGVILRLRRELRTQKRRVAELSPSARHEADATHPERDAMRREEAS